MTKKRLNGQFFTKKSDYILNGFGRYIRNKEVIDPFAGNQDLMLWAKNNEARNIKGFDIDTTYVDNKYVFENDSINKPKKYKFVLTNPPYLHKNKATQGVKEKYFFGQNSNFEDLYQVSIKSILDSEEGILIVPLNFLSAENSAKTRHLFFDKFRIIKLNIFKERVFEDTTYNVISFYFKRKKDSSERNEISATIFPEKKHINFTIERKFNWQLGGEFISRVKNAKNHLGIFRLSEDYLMPGKYEVEMALQNIKNKKTFHINKDLKELLENNILFLRAIDSKNGKKIQLEDIRDYETIGLVGKQTSRNMAHIIFKNRIDIDEQKKLINYFNKELNKARENYYSLFLTNFRDNNRKRISFDFAYKFINHIYFNQLNKSSNKEIIFNS